MSTNDFAARARLRKVLALAARVPTGADPEECDQIATFFEKLTQADRDAFAADAGVKTPSDVTWELLIQVLRDRAVNIDPFARIARREPANMSANIIDPAYVESECTACGGRGVSGDDYTEYLTRCLVCEGTGFAERCPCGERVPMTFVPDQHGVRLCGGPGCDGSWEASLVAEESALRLLDGRSPAEEGLDIEDETVEIGTETMGELVHGKSGAAA